MITITKRGLIRDVVNRWRQQYECSRSGMPPLWVDARAILKSLQSLDLETATAEEVNEIIGNDSWTRLECDECRKPVDAVSVVGHGRKFSYLCVSCVGMAAEMLSDAEAVKTISPASLISTAN